MNRTDLNPIISAVQQAAQLCQHVQQRYLSRNEKTGREPVTIADYGSQAIIGRAISRAFPDDAIIAEEQAAQFLKAVPQPQRDRITQLVAETLGEAVTEADLVRWLDHGAGRQADRTWVIDPIDGTKGFLKNRRYSIAVGMLDADKTPAGAVIACPGYDGGRLFYVSNGQTFVQALDGSREPEPVCVSQHVPPATLRILESFEADHADHAAMARVYALAGFSVEARRMDGQDKYAVIAAGDAEVYLRITPDPDYRAKIWDHAAGTALVEAAGGVVTDIDGKRLDFSAGTKLFNNRAVLVTNGKVHQQVLNVVASLKL